MISSFGSQRGGDPAFVAAGGFQNDPLRIGFGEAAS
jgi:hypothetical protein